MDFKFILFSSSLINTEIVVVFRSSTTLAGFRCCICQCCSDAHFYTELLLDLELYIKKQTIIMCMPKRLQ